MTERRPLTAGLTADPETEQREEAFVYGTKKTRLKAEEVPEKVPAVLPQLTTRVPITVRCKPELASRLKRASLERQLSGQKPYYTQEIVEEALDDWLHTNGFL